MTKTTKYPCACGCGRSIPLQVRIAAETRGQVAKYATPACRLLEAKRRQRAGTTIPRRE